MKAPYREARNLEATVVKLDDNQYGIIIRERENKNNIGLSCVSAISSPVVGVFILGMTGIPFVISEFFAAAGKETVKFPGMPNQYITDKNELAGALSSFLEEFYGFGFNKFKKSLSGICIEGDSGSIIINFHPSANPQDAKILENFYVNQSNNSQNNIVSRI